MKKKKKNANLNLSFTFKDGELKEEGAAPTINETTIEKAKRCSKPFTELTDSIMEAISKFMQDNKDNPDIDGKEMTMLVVGALAFVSGHFYHFLRTRGLVANFASFGSDFVKQIAAAVKMFEDKTGDQ